MIFPPFGNGFFTFIKIYNIERSSNSLSVEKKDICDYNPRCLMSSGFVFYDNIMNILRNKALEFCVVVVDRYFTKTDNKTNYMYRGSLQEFYWKKVTHENIDFVCPHFNAKIIKMRQYCCSLYHSYHKSTINNRQTVRYRVLVYFT